MSQSTTSSLRDYPRPPNKFKRKDEKNLPEDEHLALCEATDAVLRKTISSDEHLSYLPPDCTLEELQAEIALARGLATTIYVKRDGLSTLKVVLPQPDPTIANLKRAIERTVNSLQRRKALSDRKKTTLDTKSSIDTPPRVSDGALIVASRSGRPHRRNPSWRFLWRAYCLSKVTDKELASSAKPLPDTDGRQLLNDFGVGHKSVLRFVKRENYFGRQRQRS